MERRGFRREVLWKSDSRGIENGLYGMERDITESQKMVSQRSSSGGTNCDVLASKSVYVAYC